MNDVHTTYAISVEAYGAAIRQVVSVGCGVIMTRIELPVTTFKYSPGAASSREWVKYQSNVSSFVNVLT